jgi:hypothetical protein
MMSHRTAVLEQLRNANLVAVSDTVPDDDLSRMRAIVNQGRLTMTTPVRDPIDHEKPLLHQRPRFGPATVFTMAAIMLIASLGTALVLFSSGDDAEPTQPPPTPTTIDDGPASTPPPTEPTTVTTAGTAPPVVIGSSWTPVSGSNEIFGEGFATNVAAVGDEFLAVGAVGEDCHLDATRCQAAIWRSSDGVGWDRLYVNEPAGGEIGTWLWDVTWSDRGYLAIGEWIGPNVLAQEPLLVASLDGAVWEEIESTGIVLDGARLRAVAATDGSYLVAGQSCETACNAVVWWSADAANWTKVLDDSPANSSITALEHVGDRYFAVGGAELDESADVAMIWSSVDGRTWTEVSGDPNVFGAHEAGPGRGHWQARAVAAGGPGYVVVGAEFETGGVVWLSADGTTWTRPPREAFAGAALNGVVEVDDELIVVGTIGGREVPNLAVAWRSADGVTWERFEIDSELSGSDSAFWQLAGSADIAIGALDVDGRAAIWAIDLGE